MTILTNRFLCLFFKFLWAFLLGIFVFTIFRLLLVSCFGNYTEIAPFKDDLNKAYWFGFRFDTVVLTYLMLPMIATMLAGFFVPGSVDYQKHVGPFLKWYLIIVFFLAFILLTADFFFFKFFQSHFNLLVFGIVEDDTKAVLTSVWTDYPVIRLCILFVAMFFFFKWFFNKIFSIKSAWSLKKLWMQIAFPILFLGVYGLGMRGSLGTFPLEKDNATISPNNFINDVVMNGVYALKDAIADRNHFAIDTDMQKTLKRFGFENNKQVVEAFLGKSLPENGNLLDSLFEVTKKNPFLEENPPNVILIVIESMSNYYIDLHSDKLNILGSLEKELENCLLYRNFVSWSNGTVHTLEGFFINTPLTPIEQSQYFQHTFSTSCALPFLEKGYHTAFITGSKLGWRNMGKFLEKQYFQQVEGSADISKYIEGATDGEWGVFDGFVFDRIFNCLNENARAQKPAFIFGFTLSNHTPFQLPSTYTPYNVEIPDSIANVLRTDISIARKNFTSAQYANDCLGKFIERVRNSPWGQNTIIAATGDHNTLQLFDYTDSHLLQKVGVPLILYVPEKYRNNIEPDVKKFASQKDVLPTLYNLSLSEAKFVATGNNLFDTTTKNNSLYGVNGYNTAFSEYGAVISQSSPLYYKWADEHKKTLMPADASEVPELETLYQKVNAYAAASALLIQQDLQKSDDY